MNSVDAIKNMNQIKLMKEYLKLHSDRDYCFFLLGINTGIKLQDLLQLHVKDVCNEAFEINEILLLPNYENPPIYLNHDIRNELHVYLQNHAFLHHDYLFKSRKTGEPISRQQAYRVIHEAANQAGIQNKVGITTLRKTFGYHAYQKGIAISLIQKRLQHTNSTETMHFIGVSKKGSHVQIDVNL